MFHVWNITGLQQTYTPEIFRSRRVNAVSGTLRPAAVGPDKEGASSKVAQAYDQDSQEHEQKKVLCAQDIMHSPVVSVSPATDMARVFELMTKDHYRHLPVLNENNCPIGIVSDRAVLTFNVKALKTQVDPGKVPVSEVMEKEVLTAIPEAPIRDVARVMFDEHIGAVPIVNTVGSLVGIVTRSDILRTLIKSGPIQLWV